MPEKLVTSYYKQCMKQKFLFSILTVVYKVTLEVRHFTSISGLEIRKKKQTNTRIILD